MNYSEMYNKLQYWYNYEVQEYATPKFVNNTFTQLLDGNSFHHAEKSKHSLEFKEKERTENTLVTYNSRLFLL